MHQKVTPKGPDQASICDELGVRMCWLCHLWMMAITCIKCAHFLNYLIVIFGNTENMGEWDLNAV